MNKNDNIYVVSTILSKSKYCLRVHKNFSSIFLQPFFYPKERNEHRICISKAILYSIAFLTLMVMKFFDLMPKNMSFNFQTQITRHDDLKIKNKNKKPHTSLTFKICFLSCVFCKKL